MKVQLTGLINRELTLILFDEETGYGYFSDKEGNQYRIPYYGIYSDDKYPLKTSAVYIPRNGRQEVLLSEIKEGEYFTFCGGLYRKEICVEDPDDWEDVVVNSSEQTLKLHIEIPVLRFK